MAQTRVVQRVNCDVNANKRELIHNLQYIHTLKHYPPQKEDHMNDFYDIYQYDMISKIHILLSEKSKLQNYARPFTIASERK